MGQVKKIGQEYYIEFFARGLKYQQKVGTNFQTAQQALLTIEAKIARGEAALIERDVDWDIFFEDFLKEMMLVHSVKTLTRYRQTVEHFTQFLNAQYSNLKKLSEITPAVVEHYRDFLLKKGCTQKKIRARIINLTLLILRDLFEFARKLGYLNDNPAIHADYLSVRSYLIERKKAWPSIEPVLAVMSPPSKSFVELMLLIGLSLNEVFSLQPSQVDQDNPVIRLPSSFGPQGLLREIPLQPRAQEILLEIFKDPSFKTKITPVELFEELLRILPAGCQPFVYLRHHFALEAVKRRVPLSLLYRWLDLDDVAKVMVYQPFCRGLFDSKKDLSF